MKILGIDPGTRRIGYGIIEKEGSRIRLIKTGILTISKKDDTGALLETKSEIERIVKEFSPDTAAIEKLFFTKNISTGIQVAHARGVICATIAALGVPISEYSPTEIKLSVTGYGLADKKSVAKMVSLILREKELHIIDDAMDALAVAITASSKMRVEKK